VEFEVNYRFNLNMEFDIIEFKHKIEIY